MRQTRTLRRQLIAWLAVPLFVLWSVSTTVDYDIAKRFVNLAYDRALLEAAQDIGRQIRVLNNQIYVDLPEVALQILQTSESGRLYYLVIGPDRKYVTGEPNLPPPPDDASDQGQDRLRYCHADPRGSGGRAGRRRNSARGPVPRPSRRPAAAAGPARRTRTSGRAQ